MPVGMPRFDFCSSDSVVLLLFLLFVLLFVLLLVLLLVLLILLLVLLLILLLFILLSHGSKLLFKKIATGNFPVCFSFSKKRAAILKGSFLFRKI